MIVSYSVCQSTKFFASRVCTNYITIRPSAWTLGPLSEAIQQGRQALFDRQNGPSRHRY